MDRIKVQNIASGETVFVLIYDNKPIETICLNPANRYQLLSFHIDGSVCIWDYDDGILLKSFRINLNVKKVFVMQTKQCLYLLGKKVNDLDPYHYGLHKFDLNTKNAENDEFEVKMLLEHIDLNEQKMQVDMNSNGKYIAFVQNRKRVAVVEIKNKTTKKFVVKNEITCLKIHPNEDCIATGTVSGKIILWYGFLNESKLTKTVLHWHALPVLSLCFTDEGSFLLSGGHECVLVKWIHKTGHKDFKPRLGAPINNISCSKDNTLYAISHTDNSIHVIGSNYNILQTFISFVKPHAYQNDNPFPCGLTYFPRLNCLVTNSKPGHLQFFVPSEEKLLFDLDIVDENYISPENLQRPRIHTDIEHLAFSSDGNWLATVERRDDRLTTPEIKLKFWSFNPITNKFTLNTLVRCPHIYEKINRIKFKPNENLLITCGADNCFKSWILCENILPVDKPKRQASSWTYDTCNGYRNMMPSDLDFSSQTEKSSLVAIVFGHIVSLWNTENNMDFVADLIHCDQNDPINQVQFASNAYLIAVHQNVLNIWNLTSYKCEWSRKLNIVNIIKHPVDDMFIAFLMCPQNSSQNNMKRLEVALLVPSENRLDIVRQLELPLDDKLNLICLKKSDDDDEMLDGKSVDIELNSALNNVNIYYCNREKVLQQMNFNSSSDNQTSSFSLIKFKKNLPQNSLSILLNQQKTQKVFNLNQRLIDANSNFESSLRKINATPSYLLPKVSAFCHETLKSMLRFKSMGNSATIDSLMDVDQDDSKPNGHFEMNGYQNGISSDEEETERTTSAQKTNLVVKLNNEKKKLDESLMHCFKLEDFLINSLK